MKRWILYISFIFLGYSAVAQDSLAVYLETAAKNNPVVLQRFKEYEAALQKVPQVGALPDPQFEMGVFLKPMEVLNGKQVADLRLMQMFPWFGVLKNAKDEMSRMAQMKFEVFRDAKLQVFYEVQQSWFDLYRIRREKELTQKNIELLKSIERMSVVSYSAGGLSGSNSMNSKMPAAGTNSSSKSMGMSSMSATSSTASPPISGSVLSGGSMKSGSNVTNLEDVYDLKIDAADLENSLALLKDEETVVIARFNALLNRSENTFVTEPDTLTNEPLDIHLLTYNDSLLTRNPMLGMLNYEQASLDSRAAMQKKMEFPMIGLGINYTVVAPSQMSSMNGHNMNGHDMIMPMLTVTLPVNRKKNKAILMETKLMKEASVEKEKATQLELRTEYLDALKQYFDSDRNLKLYKKQKDLLQKSLEIGLKSFSAGKRSFSDIQSLQRRLVEYEIKETEALTDFNKSKARIKRLIP